MQAVEAYVAMSFGALLAFSGVGLLFYRQEHGQNRLKILGQELDISTPAVLLVLLGCAFFAVPLITPVREALHVAAPTSYSGALPTRESRAVSTEVADGPLEAEAEPNESPGTSSPIPVGVTLNAEITSPNDTDFYKFHAGGGISNNLNVVYSPTKYQQQMPPLLRVYDESMNLIGQKRAFRPEILTVPFTPDQNKIYYIAVSTSCYSCEANRSPYELSIHHSE